MRDLILMLFLVAGIFMLTVVNKRLDIEIARSCNARGGMLIDGLCQRPAQFGIPSQ